MGKGIIEGARRAALVAAAVALVVSGLWRCPFKSSFGVPCPGCGLTRATLAALRGDFQSMWALHPLALLLVPLLVFAGARPIFGARVPALPSWLWLMCGVLLLLVWGVRLALGMHPDPIALERGLAFGWWLR